MANSAFVNNFTCGNINTSFLTGLTFNVQTQHNSAGLTTGTQTVTGAKTFSSEVLMKYLFHR